MLDNSFFEDLKFDRYAPAKGMFLVSEPFLPDPNFSRTVILLTEHNDKGSFGLVLNKTMDIKPEDVLETFTSTPFHLYSGGPVSLNEMFYIHALGNRFEGSMEILPGLFWGGNFEQITAEINQGTVSKDKMKFFAGYSGWGAGQLQSEINQKSWIVLPGDAATALIGDDQMWKSILARHGKKYEVLSNFPQNPDLN